MTQADLSRIPDFIARFRADADFRTAKECRENATRMLRNKAPGWRFSHRLELKRAMRFWRHYAEAVRSVQ